MTGNYNLVFAKNHVWQPQECPEYQYNTRLKTHALQASSTLLHDYIARWQQWSGLKKTLLYWTALWYYIEFTVSTVCTLFYK